MSCEICESCSPSSITREDGKCVCDNCEVGRLRTRLSEVMKQRNGLLERIEKEGVIVRKMMADLVDSEKWRARWQGISTVLNEESRGLHKKVAHVEKEHNEALAVLAAVRQGITVAEKPTGDSSDLLDLVGVFIDHHKTVENERNALRTRLAETEKQYDKVTHIAGELQTELGDVEKDAKQAKENLEGLYRKYLDVESQAARYQEALKRIKVVVKDSTVFDIARIALKGKDSEQWICPCNYMNIGPICTACGQSRKECDTKPLRIKSGDLPPPKGITFDPPDACPHGKALKDCPNCVGIKE